MLSGAYYGTGSASVSNGSGALGEKGGAPMRELEL